MGLNTDVLVTARRLTKHFQVKVGLLRGAALRAVDGVSLEVRAGETLGVVGESGCGKTTLARLLVGLVPATSGEVRFLDQRIDPRDPGMRRLRRHVQIIFQDPYSSLNPRMTVGETVVRPLVVHQLGDPVSNRARVAELFRSVGLPPEFATRYPHELSGGQRQRIAVARAIATSPRFIVADEPTSGLDVSVQAKILNLLRDLQVSLGLTYVLISHDLRAVRHMSQRVTVMYLGKTVEIAPTERLFTRPLHPYTKALLAAVPQTDPSKKHSRFLLEGDPPSPLRPPSGCSFHPRCPWARERCSVEEPALREVEVGQQVACHFAEVIEAETSSTR